MSSTLSAERLWCQDLSGDRNLSNLAIAVPRLNRLIISVSLSHGASFSLGEAWDEDAVSLTADTADYTLPNSSSEEYAKILLFKLDSTGEILTERSPEVLERLWRRSDSGSFATGDPQDYYLLESTTQAVTIRLGPIPNKTDSLHVLRSLLPVSTLTDATVIPFSDLGLTALRYEVASQMIAMMSEQQKAERHIGPDLMNRLERYGAVTRRRELSRSFFRKVRKVPVPR